MLAHEIADMVLVEIEKPVKPGSLHELHGGTASWRRSERAREVGATHAGLLAVPYASSVPEPGIAGLSRFDELIPPMISSATARLQSLV